MFLHTWIPTATFDIGGVEISLYGLVLALGLITAYCLMIYFSRHFDRVQGTHYEDYIDGLFWWVFIPAIVGARVLFILYHPDYFLSTPQEMIAIWHGGIVWHGALIGGMIGSFAYCRRKHIPWLHFADYAAPALALGQALGRWGNYFNQENYGLPTSLPWGIPIDAAHRLPGFEQFNYFHPTFLYESLWDMALFVVLFVLVYRWALQRKAAWYRSGMLFFAYIIAYSIGRFGIEFLRIDTVPIFWGFRLPQWWSVDLTIAALIGLWFLFAHRNQDACISRKR